MLLVVVFHIKAIILYVPMDPFINVRVCMCIFLLSLVCDSDISVKHGVELS